MKRIERIVATMLVLTSGVPAFAQDFDETFLSGTWQVQNQASMTGVGGNIISFSSLVIEPAIHSGTPIPAAGMITGIIPAFNCESWLDGNDYIKDFFISNGNKLHLQFVDDLALRFTIGELTDSELVLTTFDGTSTVTLRRASDASVAPRLTEQDADSVLYDLQGRRAATPPPPGIYLSGSVKQLVK